MLIRDGFLDLTIEGINCRALEKNGRRIQFWVGDLFIFCSCKTDGQLSKIVALKNTNFYMYYNICRLVENQGRSFKNNKYESKLVLEWTPKYRTSNTLNIECPNIAFWPKIELRTCRTSQKPEQFANIKL